jgi:hypothetical protein
MGAVFILARAIKFFVRFMPFEDPYNPLRLKENYGHAGKVRTSKLVFAAGAVHHGVSSSEHKSACAPAIPVTDKPVEVEGKAAEANGLAGRICPRIAPIFTVSLGSA